MDAFYFPRGEGKIPPKFHFIPPKFYFILPKFYFSPTWRIFIFHVEIGEFPRGRWRERGEWRAFRIFVGRGLLPQEARAYKGLVY